MKLLKNKTVLATLCLVALYTVGSVMAQLQQSGGPGSTVTANQGTAGAQSWKVDISGTSANATAIKVDGSAVTQPVSGTVSVNALPTGSNVIGTVDTIPKTACANVVASQALAAVPTSSTAVFSSTTCIVAVILNNTNGTSATVTVTDNQGTPVNDILTFSIPANSQLIQPLYGVAFTSGLKWAASGSGVTGAVIGYQ